MRKLTHPLGPVKAGKLLPHHKLPGSTLAVPHAAQAGAQQADSAGAAGAVKALQTPAALAKLAALVSNTVPRSPTSGR